MAYVIQRTDGVFVSDPRTNGTGGSYTPLLQKAKVFATREAAERELCPENERIVNLDDLMRPR